ncbi:MAG: hypothetical protein ACTHOG_07205 [Marmoricola sp.]
MRILCISFSDIRADARVIRQLEVLRQHGEVTTLGYGSAPDGVDEHLTIDAALPSLPQTPLGVIKLALRRYRSVELDAPAVRAAATALAGREFDVIVANEARSLPLAVRVRGSARVWCDLHEWAPEERSHVLPWRLLVAPFMAWVCRTYLPQVDAATAVNGSIAALYDEAFGVRPEVVRNAIAFQPDLAPSAGPDGVIRLVHSGAAVPGRNLEQLIDAVDLLEGRFSLDLYLVRAREGGAFWRSLVDRVEASPFATLHDPVPPADLPRTLNPYDLGVFLLPPHTPNHRLMLPNKFFDFVQARIGVVFSTAVETDRLIQDYGLGVGVPGFEGADLAEALRDVSEEQVRGYKLASDRAARELSSDADVAVGHAILDRLAQGR